MEQTLNVEGYGDITFKFDETKEDVLDLLASIEKDDAFLTEIYEVDVQSTQEAKENELKDIRLLVEELYKDCTKLATKEEIAKYGKKKNGKFRKGAVNDYKNAEKATYYETEFTNSWEAFTIFGKVTGENEIEVRMELKWYQY